MTKVHPEFNVIIRLYEVYSVCFTANKIPGILLWTLQSCVATFDSVNKFQERKRLRQQTRLRISTKLATPVTTHLADTHNKWIPPSPNHSFVCL